MVKKTTRNLPCPLCRRKMDRQKDMTPITMVFTCRHCVLEVTAMWHEADRAIADFLEQYYPEKDDKVKNGG